MTIQLTQNYFEALKYASEAHAGTYRKGTSIPYICHPIAVSAYVLEAGGDEDQAIGALLHDVAEDCGGEPRLHDIEVKFNERVAEIVRGCSDSLEVDPTKKVEWRIRKEQHLAKLVDASDDILIVTAADKLHNARSIATDFQNIGAEIWHRFNAKETEVHWYYEEVFKILKKRAVSHQLLRPLEVAIRIMQGSNQ